MARRHENVARLVGDKEGSMAHLVRIVESDGTANSNRIAQRRLFGRKSVNCTSRCEDRQALWRKLGSLAVRHAPEQEWRRNERYDRWAGQRFEPRDQCSRFRQIPCHCEHFFGKPLETERSVSELAALKWPASSRAPFHISAECQNSSHCGTQGAGDAASEGPKRLRMVLWRRRLARIRREG